MNWIYLDDLTKNRFTPLLGHWEKYNQEQLLFWAGGGDQRWTWDLSEGDCSKSWVYQFWSRSDHLGLYPGGPTYQLMTAKTKRQMSPAWEAVFPLTTCSLMVTHVHERAMSEMQSSRKGLSQGTRRAGSRGEQCIPSWKFGIVAKRKRDEEQISAEQSCKTLYLRVHSLLSHSNWMWKAGSISCPCLLQKL